MRNFFKILNSNGELIGVAQGNAAVQGQKIKISALEYNAICIALLIMQGGDGLSAQEAEYLKSGAMFA